MTIINLSQFLPIKDFPEYAINTSGQVLSVRFNRILKPQQNPVTKYYTYNLCVNGVMNQRYAHRLVLQTFSPTTDTTLEANHIDYDRSNNTLQNLEWLTHSDNIRYSKCRKPKTYKKKNNK